MPFLMLRCHFKKDIVEYLEMLNKPFGGYVKKLIRENMEKDR